MDQGQTPRRTKVEWISMLWEDPWKPPEHLGKPAKWTRHGAHHDPRSASHPFVFVCGYSLKLLLDSTLRPSFGEVDQAVGTC